MNEKILVVGACGQIGTELTFALRAVYGSANVIAADIKNETDALKGTGPFLPMDILHKELLHVMVRKHKITQIYLLSAMLSATGEQQPHKAWQLNMQSLVNVLEVAREEKLDKIFWPSSIAVFGPSAPKINCPQGAMLDPTTVYGISKMAGEQWCKYYFDRYKVDVRSLRYPGLISYTAAPGGGTTDYAVEIFHAALNYHRYTCFLEPGTVLPMMYMPDAIRATLELMHVSACDVRVRSSYNIAGMSFSPQQIGDEISRHVRPFEFTCQPDFRQCIAENWPASIDDAGARQDWGWKPEYHLKNMVSEMLEKLSLNKKILV